MSIILPLLIFLVLNIYPVIIFRCSFGKTFSSTLILSTFILYISGILFHDFRIGYYTLLILCVFGFLFIIYKIYRKDDFFIKSYFSKGFYIIILYFVFTLVLNWNRGFNYIDEYCFWGFLTKEAFRLNDFYFVSESRAWFNIDYFPFYTLFETLWCYLIGYYKETFCYQALSFFTLSLFSCVFEDYKSNRYKTLVLFVISILLGLTVNYTDGMVYTTLFYNSIYIDLHIGVFLGYIFYLVLKNGFNNVLDNIILIISLSGLVLTKQISIVFIILFFVIEFIIIIVNKKISKKSIICLIIILIIPIICYESWGILLKIYDIGSKFSIKGFNYFVIIDFLLGKTNSYVTDIIKRFIVIFFTRPIIVQPVKLSYFALIIIISIIIFLPTFINVSYFNKKIIIINSLMYFLGGLGYAYAMLIAYAYGFDSSEAPGIIMFDRYMMTYVIAGFAYIFYLYYPIMNDFKFIIGYLFVILSMISPSTYTLSKPELKYNGQESFFTERFNSLLYEYSITDNLLVIHQGDVLKSCILRYYADKDIVYRDVTFNMNGSSFENKCEAFNELISDYDYVYLAFFDDNIIEIWNRFNSDEAKQDHLYKVTKVGDLCKLTALYNDW